MNIGEFFIELGAKGSDKLMNVLKGVNENLKGMKETSLATKASLAAMAYGIERMTRYSTQMGAGFAEFSKYTGLSTKALQQWQYAGRQANVTNDEVQNSIMGVARAMGNMMMGKGAPEGLAVLADTVGFDIDKAKDTMYVMEKLQKFASTFKGSESLKNQVIESFGVNSTAMISAMKKNAFNPDSMKNAPMFSGDEINKLAKMNAQMSEFYNNMQLSMGKLVVEFMPEIVSLMDSVSRKIKDIAFGFDKGSDGALVFKTILEAISSLMSMIIEGWKPIISGVADFIKMKDKLGFGGAISETASSAWDAIKEAGSGLLMDTPLSSLVTPSAPAGAQNNSNVSLKQEIKFGSDKVEPKDIMNDMKGVFESTFRQMNQGAMK